MSDWTDLPNWKNSNEYTFLKNQSPSEWAWEFLRRNSDYRKDWEYLRQFQMVHGESWAKQEDAYRYFPEKVPGETFQNWQSRIVRDKNNDLFSASPVRRRLDVALGVKWSVTKMFDPHKSYSDNGLEFISPRGQFPRLLHSVDDFAEFTGEEFTHSGTPIDVVTSNIAVLVVNLGMPLDPQLKAADAILRRQKKVFNKLNLSRVKGHQNKPQNWLRHLRVLDARRSSPIGTYAEISKVLGPQKSLLASIPAAKEGQTFYKQAKTMASSGYKLALLSKSVPVIG